MHELEQIARQRGGVNRRDVWATPTADGLWQVRVGQHMAGAYLERTLGDPCPQAMALRTLELNQRLGWRL